ncbi:MAG: TonB-dependent receptor, partial [Bdellovibrionales bacterium]|nr:TonB-dependent receptor [Bdellovibrionales bacterium]
LTTAGVSSASEALGNSENDGYENISASSRVGANFLADGRVDTTLQFDRGLTDIDGFQFGVGPVDVEDYTQRRTRFSGRAAVSKPLTDWLTPKTYYSFSDERLRGRNGNQPSDNFDIKSRVQEVGLENSLVFLEDMTTLLGYSFEHRHGENIGNFEDSVSVHSFYLHNQFQYEDWLSLGAGIRNDNHSTFSDETTFRLTASATVPVSQTRLHSSFGSGFRAPNFNELFFPGFGNLDLKPEKALGYDVGVEQALFDERLIIDVTFFHSLYRDLIDFDDATFTAININKANAYGFETTVDLEVCEQLSLRGSYTFTESENEATGDLLPRRPRHDVSLTAFLDPVERLTASTTLFLVNSRVESSGENMDNYERVDAALSYEVAQGFSPYVRFENLFDQRYEELPGLTTPGFTALGGVEFVW